MVSFSPLEFEIMASQVVHDPTWDSTASSVRSRASSIVSTGTKFSIATLSAEELQNVEPGSATPTSRSGRRPLSLMTLASHEQSAPPYDNRQVSSTLLLSLGHQEAAGPGSISSPQAESLDLPAASPSVDVENTLTAHYGRIVRTIDERYAAEILQLTQTHERELSVTRHEIDQAYRKEWKTRNREVEKFREEANTRVAELEAMLKNQALAHGETVERIMHDAKEQMTAAAEANAKAINKARHVIEDIWEGRWSDRTRLEAEEARRIELENQRKLEKAIADRDEEWVRQLEDRHPELLSDLQDTISDIRARQLIKSSIKNKIFAT